MFGIDFQEKHQLSKTCCFRKKKTFEMFFKNNSGDRLFCWCKKKLFFVSNVSFGSRTCLQIFVLLTSLWNKHFGKTRLFRGKVRLL